MKLDKVITLANSKVRLRFLAMERSLREVGCNLPLWVIPYDNQKFELPPNAFWWEVPEITAWLKKHSTHPTMRKYQCLTVGNYQFVDADVVFLINPEDALKDKKGFVTSCGHWSNPGHTYTGESLKILKSRGSLWQKFIFNTGQFACDAPIYSMEALKIKAESPELRFTCLQFPYHEQPGINLLVNTSQITISNLTLPPYNMESTWAGDYTNQNFAKLWNVNQKPYLIHWAGCAMNSGRPIDSLFYGYLTGKEKEEWDIEIIRRMDQERTLGVYVKKILKKIKRAYNIILE